MEVGCVAKQGCRYLELSQARTAGHKRLDLVGDRHFNTSAFSYDRKL
jgi:hypothetical protein